MNGVPLGRFNNFGRSFLNQGSNFMNPNPMNPNPLPRQNLFGQILSNPGVQSQIPNLMRGLQQKFMPGFGQGGNSQLFGPVGPAGQGSPFAPFGQGGGVPPQASGNLENNFSIQNPPAPPQPQPRSGGWLQDILSRLRIGK